MADNYTDPDDGDDADDFKNMRAKARKADQLEKENAALKRENAFVRAGIPIEDARMGYFVKGYEGDLDPNSIKQAAIDAGFMAAPERTPDPAVDQSREGQQRVMDASVGANPIDDFAGIDYQMEQAYNEAGLDGLSAVTQQYGVTFNPTPI
jgi:hypothetical protein